MNKVKTAAALLFGYSLLAPIFGIGLVTTASGHLMLAHWYVVGFELGFLAFVGTGFYTLYNGSYKPESHLFTISGTSEIDYQQAEGFTKEKTTKKQAVGV